MCFFVANCFANTIVSFGAEFWDRSWGMGPSNFTGLSMYVYQTGEYVRITSSEMFLFFVEKVS